MPVKVGDQVQFQVWNQDMNSILGAGQSFMLAGGEVGVLWHLSGISSPFWGLTTT